MFWLTYWLWCKWFGHRMGPWFEACGPEGTKARNCRRCLHGQHLIHGVETEVTR